MKKTLSLLLAVIMVLSVCSSLFVVADDRENLAAGKSYVISEQFRQSNITWGYDESFPPAYPDDGGELTDGAVPADDEGYLAAGWVGFNQNTPAQKERGYAYVTIDLEEVSDITGVSVAYGKDTSVGITVPYWVEYHVSNDGESYKQMGYSEINPEEAVSGTNWYGLDFDIAARYVQIRVVSGGWAFLGEIEVYGTGTAPVDPEPEEPVAEEHTINVSHVNAYSWGEFYSFVITEVGKNCTNNSTFQYACDWWYAIKVVDDTVTAIEGPGTAKTMMVEEGGFILYTYSNRADDWAAAGKVEVGDVLLENTVDLSAKVASETPIGIMTFGPKQTTEPVEPEDPPVEEPEAPSVKASVLDGSVKIPADDVLAKLADGNLALDATAFGDAGLVAFENTGFTHTDGVDAAVPATIAITVDLGEVKTISKASLSAYKESNSMIALPSVKFEISVDGVNFYDINAGGTVSPADDLAESATATLTADFSTRIAANARYVRAIATFRNGWVFLSEVSVTLDETHTGMNPDAAFPYADKVSGTAVGVYDAEDGELDLNANFKNSQLIKAVYDEAAGAYKVIYSKVNPWPDGQTGFETMGENEILVAINTGGVLVAQDKEGADTTNLFSGCKWIARGLTEGDYLVFREGTVTFYPAEGEFEAGECITKTEEPVDPPVDPEPPVEDPINVALNKNVLNATKRSSYNAGLTDGVALDTLTYNAADWFGFYWNPGMTLEQNLAQNTNAIDGMALPTVDLAGNFNVTSVRVNTFMGNTSGICAPEYLKVLVSDDNETFTELAIHNIDWPTSGENYVEWIEFDLPEGTTAKYVRVEMKMRTTFVFINEIEVYGTAIPEDVVEPVEGEGNLALNRGWYGDTNSGSGYVGDVTDGVIDPDGKYDTTLWYGFDQRKIDDGVASMIIDLGTLYGNIQNVKAFVWPAGYAGIAIPTSITFYASEDGEEFVELGVITAFDGTSPQWIGIDFDDLLTARYIKMDIAGTQDTGVFWFVGEIEVNAKAAEVPPVDPPVDPEPVPNTEVEVNVNDNEILTDGETGFTAGWGEVGTGKVELIQNTNCTAAGMDVTLLYALGETKKIDSVTVDLYYDKNVMIGYPEGQATVLVSTDGETYTEVGKFDLTAADFSAPGTVSNVFAFDAVEAAYVKVLLYAGSSTPVLGDSPADGKIFWEFISVAEFAVGEVVPEEPKIWEDTYTVLENGNAQVDIPYGYTWTIDDIDGIIGGEDTTLITNQDAYMGCNPNWAITLYLEKQEDGSYIALRNAIVTPVTAAGAGITLGENQVAFVVHSSSSRPTDAEKYPNWLAKVVAMSVKEGDRFIVDTENMTVYAVIPGEDYVVPEEPVEPEVPSIGDFDGDGMIAESDVELMMENLVGSDDTLADADLDLDGNGAFDIYDCVLALQYIESLAE